jgi:hypothetical protein
MICSSRVIVRDPRKFNRDVEYIFTLDDAEETVESIERKQQDGEDSQREIPIETLEEIPQNVRRTLARLTGSDWQSLTAASDLP